MTCDDILNLVDAIASGALEVTPEVREHLESCPRCASALASAVAARTRRERWSSEQRVDRIFNFAIAFALVAIVASVVALTNIESVVAGVGWVWRLGAAASAELARLAAPAAAGYLGAAAVLTSALLMWWWAERRLSL